MNNYFVRQLRAHIDMRTVTDAYARGCALNISMRTYTQTLTRTYTQSQLRAHIDIRTQTRVRNYIDTYALRACIISY